MQVVVRALLHLGLADLRAGQPAAAAAHLAAAAGVCEATQRRLGGVRETERVDLGELHREVYAALQLVLIMDGCTTRSRPRSAPRPAPCATS